MSKDYKEIRFFVGSAIDTAVGQLLAHKEKGELAFGDFNGTKLYSDTVTIDGAYLAITGKTKVEREEELRKWREDYDRKQKEHQERTPSLSEEWMKKGREILAADKWEYWDKIVPVRLGDMYHGMELGCCLNIVKILNNNGSLEEAKQEIEKQDHSGMSYRLVCSMVREFGDRGQEFANYLKR